MISQSDYLNRYSFDEASRSIFGSPSGMLPEDDVVHLVRKVVIFVVVTGQDEWGRTVWESISILHMPASAAQ